ELPKFTLELDALENIRDKWIYFVKNAGSLEYIPDNLASDPRINEAFGLINEAAMTREELEIQFKRRDFIILQRGSLALAEAKGREAGREEGMEKGREEIARNLLDILDDATIAAKTGLSEAQVGLLREE
ncbi:MAG: transposase, partial [Gallionella sp.]|nr:transposase [Gallionella sp.]